MLGFLFVATILILAWMVYQGYRTSAEELNAGGHIRFALFGIVALQCIAENATLIIEEIDEALPEGAGES